MKRFLLSLFVILGTLISFTTWAQCSIKGTNINIISTETSGSGCKVKFDLAFKMNNNGGNKIVVLQAWKEAQYPNYWKCSNGVSSVNKAPKKADLEASGAAPFLNIAFDLSTNPITVLSSYGPDGAVTLQGGYNVLANATLLDAQGFFDVSITNLTVTLPNQVCGAPITIKADVWSSQANVTSQWTPHCVICGNNFAFNYPLVDAQKNCVLPRTYQTIITNINTNQTISCTWKAYINNAPLTLGSEDILVDQYTTPVTILPGQVYVSAPRTYNGSGTSPNANSEIIVEVTTVGLANTQTAFASNPCAALPVQFTSFNAVRRNKNVELKWETATEENNKGFYVQRNTGGEWKSVAFVFSAAANGNSNTNLSYAYNDPNSLKGVSQYRILQVDIDGKGKYSEIRSVRGEEQAARVVVFPNPSAGKLNVLFEDAVSVRDIQVMDIAGRMVRQYLSVTSNSITIDNLRDGFYNIQVTDRHTGVSTVEKAVVKKR